MSGNKWLRTSKKVAQSRREEPTAKKILKTAILHLIKQMIILTCKDTNIVILNTEMVKAPRHLSTMRIIIIKSIEKTSQGINKLTTMETTRQSTRKMEGEKATLKLGLVLMNNSLK